MQIYSLPIYPINGVICPDGLLPLKISEEKYLDMVNACIDNKTSFGIVTILPEDVNTNAIGFPLAKTGIAVDIIKKVVSTDGLIDLECVGSRRIKILSCTRENNGQFTGEVTDMPDDIAVTIPDDLMLSSNILNEVLKNVAMVQNSVAEPFQMTSASWVSNRWVEILKLPLLEKQRLMELESPIMRLELIQDILENGFYKNF